MTYESIRVGHEEARPSWWQLRLNDLAREIEAGRYAVPAEEIAAAILFGRPKWGENPDLVGGTSLVTPEEAIRRSLDPRT